MHCAHKLERTGSDFVGLLNTVSSILIQSLKIWHQNIQKSKHKQIKIIQKIIKSILTYFWVNFGVKNDQKSLNSGFFGGKKVTRDV